MKEVLRKSNPFSYPFPCVLSYPLVDRAITGLVFTGLVRVIQPDAPQLVERSDWQRHAICRVALMELIDTDPRVRSFFSDLDRDSRIGVRLRSVTKTLIVGFDPDPFEQVRHFVKSDLGLSWPWLSDDLLQSFCFRAAAGETGAELQTVYQLEPTEVMAKGEKEHQAPNQEKLRRNVEWFYRNTIKIPSDSKRSIAAEYHQYRHNPKTCENCDDRRTVREAIKEVRRVLSDNIPCLSTKRPPGGN